MQLRFSVSSLSIIVYVDNDHSVKYLLHDSADLVSLNIPVQQRNAFN